jgi:hypothetical protein
MKRRKLEVTFWSLEMGQLMGNWRMGRWNCGDVRMVLYCLVYRVATASLHWSSDCQSPAPDATDHKAHVRNATSRHTLIVPGVVAPTSLPELHLGGIHEACGKRGRVKGASRAFTIAWRHSPKFQFFLMPLVIGSVA